MSMLLMVQAMNTKVGNPLRKLVLIKLADNSNDKGECFPSHQHIADQCEISKRSVINHIEKLKEMGLLRVENRVKNNEKQSNIYYLTLRNINDLGSAGDSLPSANAASGSAGDSLPPSAGAAHRTSHSFEPVNEPIKISKKDFDLSLFKQPPSEQVWKDYLQHRKNRKATLTNTAFKMLVKQVNKCLEFGYSTDAVLGEIMMRGWKGFKSEWIVKNDFQQGKNAPILDFNNTDWAEGIL